VTIGANDLTPNSSLALESLKSKIPFCAINSQPSLSDFYSDTVEAIYIKDKVFLPYVTAYIYRNNISKIYVDTETTGLDPYTSSLILIQIYAGYKIFLINTDLIGTDKTLCPYYDGLKLIMKSGKVLKIFHNGKFDIKFLNQHLLGHGTEYNMLFDTFLAEKLITAGLGIKGQGTLQFITEKYTGIKLDKTLQTSFQSGVDPTLEQLEYGILDVVVLETIYQIQKELLVEEDLIRTADLEFSIVPIIAQIELNGMLLDLGELKNLKRRLTAQLRAITRQLDDHVKALNSEYGKTLDMPNYNSPKQMIQILNDFGFNVSSSSSSALSQLRFPFPALIVNYRKISKLLNSFADPLPKFVNQETGRIHQSIFQIGTMTGRTSSSSPNLQQMPKQQRWRDLFIARPGHKLITADYSQIELRILAGYSQDPKLMDAFNHGIDLHTATASEVFHTPIDRVLPWQRDSAKVINFGIVYGMSPFGLADQLGIKIWKAKNFIDRYFQAYPKVYDTLEEMGSLAIERKHSSTLLGRKRYFPPGSHAKISRQGKNTPIQGTCGDILKLALHLLEKSLMPYHVFILNLVHDEAIVECSQDSIITVKEIVRSCMINAGKTFLPTVPVEVDMLVDDVWRK